MLKKFIFSFLASLILLFSFAPYMPALAASPPPSPWYNQGFGDWFLKVYDQNNQSEIFGERYTAAQVQWVVYGVWAFILNMALGPKLGGVVACALGSAGQNQTLASCLGPSLQDLFSQASFGSNIADSGNESLVSAVFADRSMSGISYIRHSIQKFSLVPTAHAQNVGAGFTFLDPVQKLWSGFRDIAFGLFVVVAIVFSFMIMFRVKISPQVVITVQSAIPKIIIALILVTFSYAIAGFLIDLMYVVIGLLSLVFAPVIPQVVLAQDMVFKPVDVFNILTAGKVLGAANLIGGIFNLLTVYLSPYLILLLIVAVVISSIVGWTGIGLILAWIPFLILILIVIWVSVKIMFALFKALANVLLLTIFAPLQITAGVLIPNFGFGQWIRSYISQLAVFVVTGVLWLLAWIFGLLAWRGLDFNGSQVNFTPASNVWPPLLGISQLGTTLLFAGVSFVLFTMIPKATELVQSFIAGKPFTYGTALGEALAPASFIWGQTGAPVIQGLQKETAGAIYAVRGAQVRELLNRYLPGKKTGDDVKSGD